MKVSVDRLTKLVEAAFDYCRRNELRIRGEIQLDDVTPSVTFVTQRGMYRTTQNYNVRHFTQRLSRRTVMPKAMRKKMSEETLLEVARIQREALSRVAKRMSDRQLGELFVDSPPLTEGEGKKEKA